jgi:hypothetical protein
MSTLIFGLFAALRNPESAWESAWECDAQLRLLRLVGKILASTLDMRETTLLPLASRLQYRALEVEGLLSSSFEQRALQGCRSHLDLALEVIQKGQDALDTALGNDVLSPEYFLELNADWERLARRVRRYMRNLR